MFLSDSFVSILTSTLNKGMSGDRAKRQIRHLLQTEIARKKAASKPMSRNQIEGGWTMAVIEFQSHGHLIEGVEDLTLENFIEIF